MWKWGVCWAHWMWPTWLRNKDTEWDGSCLGRMLPVNVVIRKVCSGWCSILTASRTGGLCLWRTILDSLPWESSKLCCTQTTLSSLRWVVLFLLLCLCFNKKQMRVCVLVLHSAWWAVVCFVLFFSVFPLSCFMFRPVLLFLFCLMECAVLCSWSWTVYSLEVRG